MLALPPPQQQREASSHDDSESPSPSPKGIRENAVVCAVLDWGRYMALRVFGRYCKRYVGDSWPCSVARLRKMTMTCTGAWDLGAGSAEVRENEMKGGLTKNAAY